MRPFESDEISHVNVSMKWNNEDRIITWIDDTALNDLLSQVLFKLHLLNIQQLLFLLKTLCSSASFLIEVINLFSGINLQCLEII